MHGVDDVDIAAEVAGEHALNNIAGQRLCIHVREISGIFDGDFTDCTVCELCSKTAELLTECEVRLKLIHHAWCNRRNVNSVDERLVTQNVQHLL
ncbi:hypothetical protein D3C80_1806620 [compost metagenome]